MRMRASRRPSAAFLTSRNASLVPLCTASDTLAVKAFSLSSKLCGGFHARSVRQTSVSSGIAAHFKKERHVLDERLPAALAPGSERRCHQPLCLSLLVLTAQVELRQHLHQPSRRRRVLPRQRFANLHGHQLHGGHDGRLDAALLAQLQQSERRLRHCGRELAPGGELANLRNGVGARASERALRRAGIKQNAPGLARRATRRR